MEPTIDVWECRGINLPETFLFDKNLAWILRLSQNNDIKTFQTFESPIDDYAKDGEVWHLCSFYQDPLRS